VRSHKTNDTGRGGEQRVGEIPDGAREDAWKYKGLSRRGASAQAGFAETNLVRTNGRKLIEINETTRSDRPERKLETMKMESKWSSAYTTFSARWPQAHQNHPTTEEKDRADSEKRATRGREQSKTKPKQKTLRARETRQTFKKRGP